MLMKRDKEITSFCNKLPEENEKGRSNTSLIEACDGALIPMDVLFYPVMSKLDLFRM